MRETSAGSHAELSCDDDDEARVAPLVAAGLVVLLPFVLFALGAVAVDVIAVLDGLRPAAAATDVFAALVVTSLFGLALRALAGATTPAGR
jgi:hypothetical protein